MRSRVLRQAQVTIFIDGHFFYDFPNDLLIQVPFDKRQALLGVLSHDPRPSYQRDPVRVYGLSFAGFDVRFTVKDGILTVVEINKTMKDCPINTIV